MADNLVAKVQDLYGAFGRGDVPGLLAHFATDAVWDVTGPPGAFPTFGLRKGLAEIGEFFGVLAANENFSEFAPLSFHQSDDKVFVIGHLTSSITKTGRSYASDWVHIFTFKGGKVSAFKEFFDSAAIVAAYRT